MGRSYSWESGGRRLRSLRVENNLSQAEVAKAVGRSEAFISYYETGKAGITYEMAIRFAKFYGMSLDEFTDCVCVRDGLDKAKGETA